MFEHDGPQPRRRPAPVDPPPDVEPVQPARPERPWPAPMGAAVRIGVVGRFLELVADQTEADPAAILADLLVRVGSAVHRGPHFTVSGDRHGCNLFVLVVGETACGRKGSSAAFPRRLMEYADPTWSDGCIKTGLSSGEGLIHAVRDDAPTGRMDKHGEPVIESGVSDKRLLAVEPEFARTMRAAARRESTLGPVLRQCWEGARHLAAMTKMPYSATDAHVSVLAHITPTEFRALLDDTEVASGSFNRFLFIASRRQRQLPFGGHVPDADLERLGATLRDHIAAARSFAGEFAFTAEARKAWPGYYGHLLRDEQAPGQLGELYGRGTAQVRRLAMLFAIVDGRQQVDVQHLHAALEMWRYSRDSVRYLFDTVTGNRVADTILAELRGNPDGVDRTTMLRQSFAGHMPVKQLDAALALLDQMQLAHGQRFRGGGRPREVWFAGPRLGIAAVDHE